jgi:hypothetical protein
MKRFAIPPNLRTPTAMELRRLPADDFAWWTFHSKGIDGLPTDNIWAISHRLVPPTIRVLGLDPDDAAQDAVDAALRLIACGALDEVVPLDPAVRKPHGPREWWDDDLGTIHYECIAGPGGLVDVLVYSDEEAQRFDLEDVRGVLREVLRRVHARRGRA